MRCYVCGREVKEGNFCPYCGERLNKEPDAPSFDSQPVERDSENTGREGVAMAALIVAVISFFVPLLFLVAIILGCIGLKSSRRVAARVGIILGAVSSFMSILIAGITVPTTIAVINRQKRQKAIQEVQTVFNAAKDVLIEELYGNDYPYVVHVGSEYSVTVTSLLNAGLIEYNPFETTSYTGGMTVTLNENTLRYKCDIDGTVNGFTITYNGYTFK